MTPTLSLRARLVIGSLFWSIGLLVVMSVVIAWLRRFPGAMHVGGMSVAALGLLAFGLAQIGGILRLFRQLQARLAAVRDGRSRRLDGRYPAEVQPLVTDLNALLEHREQMVDRALAKAGDLAHGLKTPLAILTQEGERLVARGDHEAGAVISQQVDRMRRQIDYHLAHARAAALRSTPGVATRLADSIDGLRRTLTRQYADRRLALDVSVAPTHLVRVHREDLDEMLGNLLDNAFKWAVSRVAVSSLEDPDGLAVTIDDDGAGVPDAMRTLVLERGVRIDEAAPGTGLGLAIVADLAALYRGSIVLARSPLGGTRARLTLPSGAPADAPVR